MMKKILAGAALAMVAMSGSAMAANSLYAGAMGLSVPITERNFNVNNSPAIDPLLEGKYMMSKDTAILMGFGFLSGGASGNSTTTFALEGGLRKYMKVDDFAPFVGGLLQYSNTNSSPNATTGLALVAEAGAEYFFAKQFSVEGKVRFGYTSVETGGTKYSYFGTTTAGLSANFYF